MLAEGGKEGVFEGEGREGCETDSRVVAVECSFIHQCYKALLGYFYDSSFT